MEFLEACRTRVKETRRRDIVNSFDLSEKDGHIYMMCSGYPVKEFRTNATVLDIILELEKARRDALRYNGMEPQTPGK